MNFTYFYYCDCGYEQVAHVKEGEKVYQCFSCSTVEGKKSQDVYRLECQVCGEKETLPERVVFPKEKCCGSCGVTGSVGFDEPAQFLLHAEPGASGPCQKCGKEKWQELSDYWLCPYCQKPMKSKMSHYWE